MSITLEVRGEYIQLDQLLKTTGLCHSGGYAHSEIEAGNVMVDGVVEQVSADAADNNTGNGAPGNNQNNGRTQPLVYKALIKLNAMHLDGKQSGAPDKARLALSAGMQTNAEILLGTRSVMEYLLSPVRKAWHEAGRER